VKRLALPLAVAVSLLAACSGKGGGTGRPSDVLKTMPPANLADPVALDDFGQVASAGGALGAAELVVQLLSNSGDPDCPFVKVQGGKTTVQGGCTDRFGSTYEGSMTAIAGSAGKIVYDDFSVLNVDSCDGPQVTREHFDGTATGHPEDHSFDIDMRWDFARTVPVTCQTSAFTIAWSVHGTVNPTPGDANHDGFPDRFTVDGNGTVGISFAGTVSSSTAAEQIDTGVCNGEPVSGSTSFTSGSHTATLTYDGTTACDGNVSYTLDGNPTGTLSDVNCDVSATGRPGGLLLFVPALALFAWRRRHAGSPPA
jgi:hypothetical protein